MSSVFVLDQHHRPLNPIHPGRARRLLREGKAAVFRRYPFVIILKGTLSQAPVQPLRLKLDPGSKTTGLAVVNDATGQVIFATELTHRGEQVHKALLIRRAVCRSRRLRKTRYRKARFANRRRPQGWLAPALLSRLTNILTWVTRIRKWCPIGTLSVELVKFDTALLQNPDVEGIAYQQGTLAGYELREYVLLKWEHTCVYCGARQVPLEIDHVVPRSRGGSHRESNLVLACHTCNQNKGNQPIEVFLKDRPAVLAGILAQLKTSLRDTAAVNTLRWELYEQLQATELPLETGSGGRTKWNRAERGLPKTHWVDAVCVGASTPVELHLGGVVPLRIAATRHQRRQMCLMDRRGFPRTKAKAGSHVQGFCTGDLVRAVVPAGKKVGTYVGRVAVRARGSFNITTETGTVQGIAARFCTILHRADGYVYYERRGALPTMNGMGIHA